MTTSLPVTSSAECHLATRREFLRHLAAGAGLVASGLLVPDARSAPKAGEWTCGVGVCGSSSQWEIIRKAGCSYVEESVGKLLNPKLPDAEFAAVADQFKAKGIPVKACNSFLPGDLKLVGPDPKHDEAVRYATKALERAKLLSIPIVVLGSGAARKVPEGFDRAKAEAQFIEVARKLGEAGQAHGVTVAMESLNRGETNFGNTLRECLKLINAINHPRVRLVADMYHMLKEDEGPEIITEAGAKIVHCHIAEKAQRTPPGTAGDDFKPYLRALKKAGFLGNISLECRWKNLAQEITPAVAALKAQLDAVGAEA